MGKVLVIVANEDEIVEMFHKINPGLSRRYSVDKLHHFKNLSLNKLVEIPTLKMAEQKLECTPEAKQVACNVLE